MLRSVGVYVNEGVLKTAAIESRLTEASKSQILRYSLLRTLMSSAEAKAIVFGSPDDLTETNGRIDTKIPDSELAMIEERFPGVEISEVARAGLALASGEHHERAWEQAKWKRGRKPRSKNASESEATES